MAEIRDSVDQLRLHDGDPVLIEELEAQHRILRALYDSARELYDAGRADSLLQADFTAAGMGSWTFENVYSFVYEQTMALDPGSGDLAALITDLDYEDLIRVAAAESRPGA